MPNIGPLEILFFMLLLGIIGSVIAVVIVLTRR